VAADPGCVTLAVDVANAFNEVRRQCMVDAVAQRAPTLLPMVAWAYGQPSRLLLLGSPDATIVSQRGIKQGDPLGPLLFCLAVQPALEAVQQAHVGVRPLGYFDDTYLQGKPGIDGVEGAFRTLCDELESVSLRVAKHKCGAYSEDATAAAAVAASLDMRVLPDGLVAAGTPVGSATFVEEHAAKQGARVCKLMDTLEGLPLRRQAQLLLLRGSLQQRMDHLTQVCE
jgi:hypothetical protein